MAAAIRNLPLKVSANQVVGQMPIIGLGTFTIETEDVLESALKAAIAAGYRHIDTAFTHTSERFLGPVLERIYAEGSVKREDLFITGRLPMHGMRKVEYFMKKSLEFIKSSYLDLYLISSPVATEGIAGEDDNIIPVDAAGNAKMDEVDLLETWGAMEKLVDGGKARAIGLSNFNSEQIQKIWDGARIKPTNLQVECHAYLPQYELQEFCRSLGITMTAYAPLGSIAFPAYAKEKLDIELEDKPKVLEDRGLLPIAQKHNRTPAQVLLKYLLQRDIAVIPMSSDPGRIRENIQALDDTFKLDTEDMNQLKSIASEVRYYTLNFRPGFETHSEYPFKAKF